MLECNTIADSRTLRTLGEDVGVQQRINMRVTGHCTLSTPSIQVAMEGIQWST